MSLSVACDVCERKFLNTKSLKKHRLERHGVINAFIPKFLDASGLTAAIPTAELMAKDYAAEEHYHQWLACVTERINGAHNPGFKGRWFRVDVNQTPEVYFRHVIKLLDVQLNSVRKASHKRPPILCRESLRYSYKLYDVQSLADLLSAQTYVPFKETATFVDDEETNDFPVENVGEFDARAAVEAAKRRAYLPNPKRPTARSKIVVSEGEGRATRELELQWWPNLYKTNFGKLTFRFFVQKKVY